MKKGHFKITLLEPSGNTSKKQVKGYLTENFGVHTDEYSLYIVSHLKTGARLHSFPLLKYAKHLAEQCEKSNFLNTISPTRWLGMPKQKQYTSQLRTMVDKTFRFFM